MVSISAVRPPARFGSLSLNGSDVVKFKRKKKQLGESWINGGFFVINPEFLKFLDGDETILEKEPLEKVTELGELKAFRHEGFWQCMDHKLDKDYLEQLIKEKKKHLGLDEKILVIGGTGFIGYHIIKEAKKRNYSIYSISLKTRKKKITSKSKLYKSRYI